MEYTYRHDVKERRDSNEHRHDVKERRDSSEHTYVS
jgi:hypothetical protein